MTMRLSSSFCAVAAALLVLLQLVVGGGNAHAQTITNVAQAEWNSPGGPRTTLSNIVELEVEDLPISIITFTPAPPSGNPVTFQDSFCNGTQGTSSTGAGATSIVSTPVTPTSELRPGQDLIFQVEAAPANVDPSAVDSLIAVITTSSGDREEIRVFETGPNTGMFMGRIPTVRMPPAPIHSDCQLSLQDGDTITIGIQRPGQNTTIITTSVNVLADPFGVVFDSETGEPVSGARVSIVDAVTGLPATVFAEDGVTPWPSTVISGQPITDGAGNVFQMGPGEYWFPLTFLGQYRIIVEPPAPYTAPSVVSPADLANLVRADGQPFTIVDGSYGDVFELVDPTPVRIDIPVDRPSIALSLTKTASRDRAQPGDVVFYSVVANNQDPDRAKRSVTLVDTPSKWLRLRPDSIRLNGAEAPDAVSITPDGRELTVNLELLWPYFVL